MNEHEIVIFVFILGFCKRQWEIAIFPGWESRINKWFDTYFNKYLPTWFPFRDAYHTFINLPVYILAGYLLYTIGFKIFVYTLASWGVSQFIGLVTRKPIQTNQKEVQDV